MAMHFYWRVIEELKFLGETWTFQDPCLKRSYRRWVQRNADSIARILEGDSERCSPLCGYKSAVNSIN